MAGDPRPGGARKARVALPGRGKRGGARLIYFVLTARGAIYLLDIYAKNAKEDLNSADKQEIRRRIEALAAEA
jgi:mRNA-degrading endonuclease RelE of RelBE toxin-antitoxin system